MPREVRTRITLFLPAPTTVDQNILVDNVLTSLIQVCGGVTATTSSPPVINGWWLDTAGVPIKDANLLVLADAPVPADDPSLSGFLDKLKLRSQQVFSQDIIWVTVHPMDRISSDDYKR